MERLNATDDHEWTERSRHWADRGTSPKDKRVRRQRSRYSLVLGGHGVSLRIEAGTLLIRNGFTHYPQKQERIDTSKATRTCRRGLSCWTAAVALPLTC